MSSGTSFGPGKVSKASQRTLEKEFEILKTVGQGSFGIVRQVRDRRDPSKVYAVKSIPIEKLQLKYKDAKDYMKEVSIKDLDSDLTLGI